MPHCPCCGMLYFDRTHMTAWFGNPPWVLVFLVYGNDLLPLSSFAPLPYAPQPSPHPPSPPPPLPPPPPSSPHRAVPYRTAVQRCCTGCRRRWLYGCRTSAWACTGPCTSTGERGGSGGGSGGLRGWWAGGSRGRNMEAKCYMASRLEEAARCVSVCCAVTWYDGAWGPPPHSCSSLSIRTHSASLRTKHPPLPPPPSSLPCLPPQRPHVPAPLRVLPHRPHPHSALPRLPRLPRAPNRRPAGAAVCVEVQPCVWGGGLGRAGATGWERGRVGGCGRVGAVGGAGQGGRGAVAFGVGFGCRAVGFSCELGTYLYAARSLSHTFLYSGDGLTRGGLPPKLTCMFAR